MRSVRVGGASAGGAGAAESAGAGAGSAGTTESAGAGSADPTGSGRAPAGKKVIVSRCYSRLKLPSDDRHLRAACPMEEWVQQADGSWLRQHVGRDPLARTERHGGAA